MEIVLPSAQEYALQNSEQQDDLLRELHEHTLSHHPEAHMISGPLQGQLLTMISQMIRPKRILEIGTFTGYSALCLAKGLAEDGMLHTIEKREADAATANLFFKKSDFANKITLHIGNALEVISNLEESWDLVFVDADKTGYTTYYEYLIDRVHPNCWLLFDNVFFHGDVLKENIQGKNGKAIHEFNQHVSSDLRVEKLMLTVRDGLTLVRKK